MYTVIICIFVLLVLGLFLKKQHGLDLFQIAIGSVIIGGLTGAFIAFSMGSLVEYDKSVITRVRPIVSMGSNSFSEGDFFIGSGTVSGVDYFYYYAVLEDGSISKGRRKSSLSFIFEGHENPRIVEYELGTFSNFVLKHKRFRYEFYVPHGTIIREFNLDK